MNLIEFLSDGPRRQWDIVEAVRDVVGEHPDKVYNNIEGCHYQGTTLEPDGCIIGQAFKQLGIDLPQRGPIRDTLTTVPTALMIDSIRLWLQIVQSGQDKGLMWSQAEMVADAALPHLEFPFKTMFEPVND